MHMPMPLRMYNYYQGYINAATDMYNYCDGYIKTATDIQIL